MLQDKFQPKAVQSSRFQPEDEGQHGKKRPGEHRHGDARHCFPVITLIRDTLGYSPRVSFETGLLELAGWMESEKVAEGVLRADAYY